MAVKKTELYSSLWASCDALRGGMDASQYKDYVLTLLFMKYVTDKYLNDKYGEIIVFDKEHDPEEDPAKRVGCSFEDFIRLKENKHIGEGMDKILARLKDVNTALSDVIGNISFNDEQKLGKGKEMVEKLTELIAIFQRPELDFRNNKATGDDIIGDAYEYLMKNFAADSGKSKGQFYTPAEVSRILAKVIGIGTTTKSNPTICDPACGSGSLLIRAVNEAQHGATGYGQEKDVATAGLAKMNAVLHNQATITIKAGNTFSDPQFKHERNGRDCLDRFDFVVANPPFSMKNWTHGLAGHEYGRFDGYGATPPEKNGDFAWLLHILKIMKEDAKAAVILPHGVLFRGNAESIIRENMVQYIKGIISLPANLFYGTPIPACIIVLDKENAENRDGIFMIDASHDFVKDGNKNRLRECDVYKIVSTWEKKTNVPHYARMVPLNEIREENDCNLNISRYIESVSGEVQENIEAHLQGGIPAADVEDFALYFQNFAGLKEQLFAPLRTGFFLLKPALGEIRSVIESNKAYQSYGQGVQKAFAYYCSLIDGDLRGIDKSTASGELIQKLAGALLDSFAPLALLDKYAVYEVLLSYWTEVMADDVLLIISDGWGAGREIEDIKKIQESGKNKGQVKIIGWEGKLVPKDVIAEVYYPAEKQAVKKAAENLQSAEADLAAFVEENSEDDGILSECTNDKGNIDLKLVTAKHKELKNMQEQMESTMIIMGYVERDKKVKAARKKLHAAEADLENKCLAHYPHLTDEEICDLVIARKWEYVLGKGLTDLYNAVAHNLTSQIENLANRYAKTLPELEAEAEAGEAKVKKHLERMGFAW